MNQNYTVYHSYGNVDILNETIYSVASLYMQKNNFPVNVVIYTDSADYFKKYLPKEVIYEEIDRNQIKIWRGEIDFVFRVKIEVLIDFCKKYQGNVLYLDSDTIFTGQIDIIFNAIQNGILLMHTNEGRLSLTKNKMFPKHIKHICNYPFQTKSGQITILPHQEMWNAGVLGFQTANKQILDSVLDLTDTMYYKFPKHTVEQLAFSYFFTSYELLAAAEKQIFHYWNFKEFRQLLKHFFDEETTFEQIIANFNTINPIEQIKPKMEFEKKPHLTKQFLKYVLKKTWQLPIYKTLKQQKL